MDECKPLQPDTAGVYTMSPKGVMSVPALKWNAIRGECYIVASEMVGKQSVES